MSSRQGQVAKLQVARKHLPPAPGPLLLAPIRVLISAMDAKTQQLVQAIHDCPTQLVYVAAGAGTQALSDILSVAGATRTLLEALVPYSEAAFIDFLGQRPDQFVHYKTAKLMAGRALTRARQLDEINTPLIGVACTATIITDRPKKGEHRAHIAIWQAEQLSRYEIHLHKGARNRTEEENLVSCIILNAIAAACRIDLRLDVPLLPGDTLHEKVSDFADAVHKLNRRQLDFFAVSAHGKIKTKQGSPQILLCGAFNPLHDGHLELAKTAVSLHNQPIAFELSADNADKPPLPPKTILDRIAQFAGRWPVYVTNAPTFVEKARLFPGTTFVVGIDTAVRILHPRYYNNSNSQMITALKEIQAVGCRFLVAGRADQQGKFHDLNTLHIPADLQNLFISIPAEQFRHDISSTALRAVGKKGSR